MINLFYEASTRTRSSFELAAKRLSADVLNLVASGSSVEKGESLRDTVATLSAYGPDAIVIRSPHAGAPRAAGGLDATPRSSTPATASTSIRRRRCSTATRCASRIGSLEGAQHLDRRRPAALARRALLHPGLHAARRPASPSPARRRSCPTSSRRSAATVRHSLDDLREADVVYALRMQLERMSERVRAVAARVRRRHFQIDARRLGPRQLLMHPGPVNRGIELSGEVIDSPQSLITEQVAAGVVVRMAVLYEVLAAPAAASGARRHAAAGARAADRMSVLVAAPRPPAELLLRGAHVLDPRSRPRRRRTTCSCATARSRRSAPPGTLEAPPGARDRRRRGPAPVPGLRRPARAPAHARARSTRRTSRPARAPPPPAATARSSRCRTRRRCSTSRRALRGLLAQAAPRRPRPGRRRWPRSASASRGEQLTEMSELREAGAVGFTDDGRPVVSAGLLRRALRYQRLCGGVSRCTRRIRRSRAPA